MTTTAPSTAELDLDKLRSLAARGEQARAELAAAELARQERRTAELAAQQAAWDRDVTTRGPDVDADLTRQQHEAQAELQRAVDEGDLAAALAAWRREASARFAQRQWRAAWRQAHERTGEGPVPPPESGRDAERDEALSFLPSLARAAAVCARATADATAELLVGERPTALPGEVLPGPEAALVHAEGCPDPTRTEMTHPSVGRGSSGAVVRCVSCGASRLLYAPPPEAEDEQAAAPGPELLRAPGPDDRPAPDGWVA